MFTPDCDNCPHHGDCAMRKANKEMRETLWNISREQSGRHDYFWGGKYYPADKEGE